MTLFKRKEGSKEVKPVPYKGKPNPTETKAKALKEAQAKKEKAQKEAIHKEKKATKEVKSIEVVEAIEVEKEDY